MQFDKEYLFNKKINVTVSDKKIKNKYGETKAVFFDGEEYNGKKTSVFAYLGVPKKEMPQGGYPAIVLVHGGGGAAFFEWVEYWNKKGFVAIAPDFNCRMFGTVKLDGNVGLGKIPDNPDAGPKGYGSFEYSEEDYKNSWSYHSVCNIIFANNILRAMNNVNSDKVVLTGISWGGVLTCITSGVDNRFKAYAPIYGCGDYYLSPCFTEEFEKYANIQTLPKWVKCYDPNYYLNKCRKPILFVTGMKDPAFSFINNSNSARLCEKAYFSYRSVLEHYHRWKDEDGMYAVYEFFNSILSSKKLCYSVMPLTVEENVVIAKVQGKSRIKKATFWYSDKSDVDYLQWDFKPIELDVSKDFAVQIPKNCKACFFEFSDMKKSEKIFSSELKFF